MVTRYDGIANNDLNKSDIAPKAIGTDQIAIGEEEVQKREALELFKPQGRALVEGDTDAMAYLAEIAMRNAGKFTGTSERVMFDDRNYTPTKPKKVKRITLG